MKPLFTVRCIRGYESIIEYGEEYRVAVVVRDWDDYQQTGQQGIGYIIFHQDKAMYPFVWDASRFEIKENKDATDSTADYSHLG